MAVPWSQQVGVHWAPELTFYERRIELLRYLEARGLLKAFRVDESEVSAQLSGASLRVSPEHCDVMVVGPTAELAEARQVMEFVLGALAPSNVHMVYGDFQFIQPLALDYDAARQSGIASVLPDSFREKAGPVDFSLLIDGHAATPDHGYQVEMGVITSDEALSRVTRRASRVGSVEDRPTKLFSGFTKDDFPSVAFFSDWRARSRHGSSDGVVEWWESSVAWCSDVVESLMDSFFTQAGQVGRTGAGQV